MQYNQLGRSGLRVSKLCLGTMTGFNGEDQAMSNRIVSEAIDAGINFIDTADCYKGSEETLGKALKADGRRDQVVLATKFGWYTGEGPNDYGSSRHHIINACERSLRLLQTDYIDLYIQHVVDANTPWEETILALDTLVRQGKVRYIGCSKHPSSMIVEALYESQRLGAARFISEQPPYNLLDRSPENELIPTCQRHGVGITPFAPIAAGLLTGKYQVEQSAESGRFAKRNPSKNGPFTPEAIEAVQQLVPLAEARGVSLAEFSMAWVMQAPGVSSVVLGARTPEYLASGVSAGELVLTEDELAAIDEIVPPGTAVSNYYEANIYRPFRMGFSSRARSAGAGAFVPDNQTGSGKFAGRPEKPS